MIVKILVLKELGFHKEDYAKMTLIDHLKYVFIIIQELGLIVTLEKFKHVSIEYLTQKVILSLIKKIDLKGMFAFKA